MTTRAQVVAEARAWLGTPYVHQHRARTVGVDCAGLIIGVGRGLGLLALDFDVNHYARQPTGDSLLQMCREHMDELPLEQLQPGDVLAVHMGGDPCHLGVVGDYPGGRLSLIHAKQENRGGRVCEHRLVTGLGMVPVAAFCLRGVS